MKLPTLFAPLATLAATAAVGGTTGVAAADSKALTVTVHTASPAGFLVNSTLVAGDKEAFLVDAQFTLADAHRLIAEILESKKTLTWVYITHFHPDHYFGLAAIKQAFPKAKLVALPATVAEIKKTWASKVKQWGPMYGDNLAAQPIVPAELAGARPTLVVDGRTLEIHGGVMGDSADNSYVWIPSIRTVIAGDIVYRGVHPWTAESTPASRKQWIKTLDELAALGPTMVVAGHKDPKLEDDVAGIKQTRDYLEVFDAAVASSKTSAEVQQKIKARYGDLQLDVILQLGADAAFKR
jgi:glyoxylase-like metal-dependent hydrolase (beta-lactamase superfamily II)